MSYFQSLPKGRKYAVSLGLVVAAYLVVVPTSNVLLESDYQTVTCGERETTIHKNDPILGKPDPERAEEMCNRAWAGIDRQPPDRIKRLTGTAEVTW